MPRQTYCLTLECTQGGILVLMGISDLPGCCARTGAMLPSDRTPEDKTIMKTAGRSWLLLRRQPAVWGQCCCRRCQTGAAPPDCSGLHDYPPGRCVMRPLSVALRGCLDPMARARLRRTAEPDPSRARHRCRQSACRVSVLRQLGSFNSAGGSVNLKRFFARTAVAAALVVGGTVVVPVLIPVTAAAEMTPEKIAKAITEKSGFRIEPQPSPKSSRTLTVEGLPRRGRHY